MYNKPLPSQNRYKYLPAADQSSFSALERRNYNRVIDQLNSQNEYLSKNVSELIIENITLKNKLYYVKDNTNTTKYNGNNHGAQPMQRLDKQSLSPDRKRPERSPLWKKKQNLNLKDEETPKNKIERQSSPGGSDLKRETIIEELSQSNFQSRNETPNAKQEKKGLFLTKEVRRYNKPADKMVKSVENKRSPLQRENEKNQMKNQVEEEEEEKEQKMSETQKMVIPEQSPEKTNPEKESPSKIKHQMIHKKDNSPYLQAMTSPKLKTETTPSRLTTPYQYTKSFEKASKLERHSNIPYLASMK